MKINHTFVVLAYKESPYLEECIKSVLNQSLKTKVIIGTSTPNDYIKSLAKKYKLEIKENHGKKGIGYDFDFAIQCGQDDLVTVAHQDDIYDYDYAKRVVEAFQKQPKSIIIFPNYYEIRKEGNVKSNLNLNIKRILLFPLRMHFLANRKFIKRLSLRFGDGISCPAVTFVKKNIPDVVFACDLKCKVDWNAWEILSKEKGYFYYINRTLMGHRIYEKSTTSEIIKDNKRTEEDLYVLCKFWPKPIAKAIAKVYANSERSNDVK